MEELTALREQIDSIDRQMAELFVRRMKTAGRIAAWKAERGIPVRDERRELELIERCCGYVADPALEDYYAMFIRETIELSCSYQRELMGEKER